MGLAIDIAVEHDAWLTLGDVDALVQQAAGAALAASGQTIAEGTELSVLLCDDAAIRALNRDWRGKDKATNVLSFPTDPSAQAYALGDIVVAFETCAREAAAEHRPLADHLVHLVVHGLFHLLGFDHEADDEAARMEQLETRSLTSLGIASPYHDLADSEDRCAGP